MLLYTLTIYLIIICRSATQRNYPNVCTNPHPLMCINCSPFDQPGQGKKKAGGGSRRLKGKGSSRRRKKISHQVCSSYSLQKRGKKKGI